MTDAPITKGKTDNMIRVNFQLITQQMTMLPMILTNIASNNKNSKPMPCSIFAMLL